MTTNSKIFWHIPPCNLAEVHSHSEVAYCLYVRVKSRLYVGFEVLHSGHYEEYRLLECGAV
jgi:hypothetical protein